MTLTVVNGACPEGMTDFISGAILTDSTPPEPAMIINRTAIFMSADCTHLKVQTNKSQLDVCWALFEQKQSNVTKYEVQLVPTDGSRCRMWDKRCLCVFFVTL